MGICGAWGAYRPLPYVYEGGSARRFRAVGAVALCVPAAPRDAMPFNNKKSQLGDVCARAVPYNVQFQRYPQGRGDPGEVAHRLGARPPPPSADTTAFSACCEGKVWFGPLCAELYSQELQVRFHDRYSLVSYLFNRDERRRAHVSPGHGTTYTQFTQRDRQ